MSCSKHPVSTFSDAQLRPRARLGQGSRSVAAGERALFGAIIRPPYATTAAHMLGQIISHYRIEEKLGEGGMGVVYRALDLQLHRPAAVKFLRLEIASDERRRRFKQEVLCASSLNHPNILAVYEAGSVDDQLYLITEFVDGGTLRDWITRGQLSLRQRLEMMTGIGDALACAHEVGILHRDVKPENILIARQGYAKLADLRHGQAGGIGDARAGRDADDGAGADSGRVRCGDRTLRLRDVYTGES